MVNERSGQLGEPVHPFGPGGEGGRDDAIYSSPNNLQVMLWIVARATILLITWVMVWNSTGFFRRVLFILLQSFVTYSFMSVSGCCREGFDMS